jgi:transcriptional regulator with GAF, ATPase, and Fis domain
VAASPYLFLVLQCDPPFGAAARYCLADVDEVLFLRHQATELTRSTENGRRRLVWRIRDRSLSSTHARLVRELGGWTLEDAGSTNGSMVNGARVTRARLDDGDRIELGETFFLYRAALSHDPDAEPYLAAGDSKAAGAGLATLSPALDCQLAQLRDLAPSSVSVLISGESGTGKELAARALHQLSGRSGAFVAVNCGALPATLVESQLFGHRKGAFSGATEDRPGLIRSADRGTLFLDEIGDLPLPAQAALLRVLQEREVMAVGATRTQSVDVRWAAATHRALDALVAAGECRADLLARLNGWTLRLPPLRERRQDLGLIAEALLARLPTAGVVPVSFTWEAARALFNYDWPLNVRELEQALSAATILSRGRIDLQHLPAAVRAGPEKTNEQEPSSAAQAKVQEPLSAEDEALRSELLTLFERERGNVAAVARALGKAPMQIRRWAKRFAIEPDRFRD